MSNQKEGFLSLNEELKAFIEKGEKLLERFEAVIKENTPVVPSKARSVSKPVQKAKTKPVNGKAARGTVLDAVMSVIGSSGDGVSTDDIKARTGLDNRQIWGTINRAKREGKVKTVKRGLYVCT